MSYLTALSSVFGKRPLWLYYFQRDGREWWWTSRTQGFSEPLQDVFETSDVFSGSDVFNKVWEAAPLGHARYRVTRSTARAATNFVFNRSNPMAALFFEDSNFVKNKVVVHHQFLNDPDSERIIKFTGRVISVKPMLGKFTLVAESGFTEIRRKALSAVMQRPCRHALYHSRDGSGCNLNIADFETETQIVAVNGRNVTLSSAGGRDDGEFSGGILTSGTRRQMILKHEGVNLELLAPIPNLSENVAASGVNGLNVKVALGCDLTRKTCNDRFNNLDNHGGFPWMDDTPYDGKTLF